MSTASLPLPHRRTGDRVRFGLNATPMHTSWPEYLRLCQEAEAMGFDSFWVFDHFVPGPASPEGACLECFTTLAALASVTRRIQLGALVLGVTYRNPALVGKMGAMLDVISGGRFILGMGAGWYRLEHEMYGIPFPPNATRVRMLDEALALIRTLWTHQPASFQGRYYTLKDALTDPPPVQQPYPPLLVGSRGEQLGLRVVARHADQWNTAAALEEATRLSALLDTRCREVGRDPATVERTAIVLQTIAANPAAERAQQERLEAIFRQPFAALAPRVLSGPPEAAVERLHAYREAGFTHFMFSVFAPYDLAGLKVLAEQVLARLR
ncbi:MAG: TIGR03560 family F420-dependent LLM class oxidoreductase [Chloroflexi bacterium]|nr:TIGR03560 family F420-dependent LLM class oxidoreductase [Chloroflexota bacterium]GIW12404.1 MAG: LLM class F420-dependent oxidoreductase [Dehalococcoidia bacterium]